MTAISLYEPRLLRLRRWAGAALLVVGLHAACAAYAILDPAEDEFADDAAGPIVMDLVAVSIPAPVDSMDLAPGPLMEEAQQSTEAAREVKSLDDLPTVEEAPLAPDPEVVLPTGKPSELVETQEKPEEEKVTSEAPTQTEAAPVTTAPPPVEAEPTPLPTPAAAAGSAPKKSRVSDVTWSAALMAHLKKFRRYPAEARARGASGTAMIAFTLDGTGTVLSARLLKSSGSASLDEEAVALLQRASPLPQPPEALSGQLELNIPVQFHLR